MDKSLCQEILLFFCKNCQILAAREGFLPSIIEKGVYLLFETVMEMPKEIRFLRFSRNFWDFLRKSVTKQQDRCT